MNSPAICSVQSVDSDEFSDLLRPPLDGSSGGGAGRRITVLVVMSLVAVVAIGLVLLVIRSNETTEVATGSTVPGTTTVVATSTSLMAETSLAVEEPAVFPTARLHAALTFDAATETIVLFGGQPGSIGPPSEGTWLFDLDDGSWSIAPESSQTPPPRVGHAMVYVDSLDGTVMYGGGADRYIPGASCAIAYCPVSLLADTWLFDGGSAAWLRLNPVGDPGPRYGHAIAYDPGSDRVILFGGVGLVPGSSDEPRILGDTWTYDPAANRWEQIDPAVGPAPKVFGQMVYHPLADRTYLFGGMSGTRSGDADLWAFDADSAEWTRVQTSAGPDSRWLHQLDLDVRSGHLIMTGGRMPAETEIEGGSAALIEITDELWLYDPVARLWKAHAPPGPVYAHAADGTHDGVVTWLGGALYRHDLPTRTWLQLDERQ